MAMKVPKTTEEISALSCNPQISDDFPSVHGLDVGTEPVDQFFGLHFVFSCEITALNSLSPRCTFVLMADSEMPQRAAASTTLSPSIFTYWIQLSAFRQKDCTRLQKMTGGAMKTILPISVMLYVSR